MNKSNFQALVRRILTEEIKKRVPEMGANGTDTETKKDKTFASDPNSRDTKCKEEMVDEIRKAVESVDKSYTAVWDDHDDIMINGRDILFARVTPLYEDTFKIEFMTRSEDRVFFTGLTWKQVIDFVKNNLDHKNHHTGVEKARDKSYRNQDDQTKGAAKGLPQQDKPKHKTVGETKNKEKDFNEKEVKNEKDLPDQYLRDVGDDYKRQSQYKVQDPVKLRKRVPDKKLVLKQK
jgi:hypothetical protein